MLSIEDRPAKAAVDWGPVRCARRSYSTKLAKTTGSPTSMSCLAPAATTCPAARLTDATPRATARGRSGRVNGRSERGVLAECRSRSATGPRNRCAALVLATTAVAARTDSRIIENHDRCPDGGSRVPPHAPPPIAAPWQPPPRKSPRFTVASSARSSAATPVADAALRRRCSLRSHQTKDGTGGSVPQNSPV
jgi:hypothetical protein